MLNNLSISVRKICLGWLKCWHSTQNSCLFPVQHYFPQILLLNEVYKTVSAHFFNWLDLFGKDVRTSERTLGYWNTSQFPMTNVRSKVVQRLKKAWATASLFADSFCLWDLLFLWYSVWYFENHRLWLESKSNQMAVRVSLQQFICEKNCKSIS